MDVGHYNLDPEEYKRLIEQMYKDYPPITLSPEYAHYIQDNMLQLLIRLARYKFVSRMIKKTDDVLEIGSGSGIGSVFLGQHAAKVTGLDNKGYEWKEAQALNRRSNVSFIQGDFFEYNQKTKHDVIASLDVIEHMPEELGDKLIARTTQHLKPNGLLILGTPSLYSYPYQSALSKASHVKCYDQAELVALVERHYGRTMAFSMNDEVVHTGFSKLAWYYFVIAFLPKG